jgi:metallo-beta-lactamase family protein
VIEKCFTNSGVILIPAFSIGRRQELLYELEDIIYHFKQSPVAKAKNWDNLEIIVDSPLANQLQKFIKSCVPIGIKKPIKK